MSAAKIISIRRESAESTAAMERYQHLYRAAGRTMEFGETVRLGGIVIGGVLVVAASIAYQVGRAAHAGFPGTAVTLLGCAILAVLITDLWDTLFRARAHELEEAIHFVVDSSPFLSEAERAEVMLLRRRSANRDIVQKKAA